VYNTNMRRKVIRAMVRFLFWLLSQVEVVGYENFPATGGCLVVTNHMSRIDPALLFAIGSREDMTALVTDKYQRYPFFRWLIEGVGGIWINRESADFRALRAACEFLQAGGVLGIAPEGTRSRTGQLLPAKTGAAYLADRAGVPILPVAITGSEKVWRELAHRRIGAIVRPVELSHTSGGPVSPIASAPIYLVLLQQVGPRCSPRA
jgi:1-acyl-sn-glycerol-3-phosphate acyltransferase